MNDLKQREKLIYEIFLKADNEKKIAKFSNNFLYFYKSGIRCWVMLTSALGHSLRIYFRKFLTSFLWEMKKTIKTLFIFFF